MSRDRGSPSPASKVILLLSLALAASVEPTEARDREVARPAVAFFYGAPAPLPELGQFDWVVVDPSSVDARGLAELERAGALVFAYLSLGEADRESVQASWIIGQNRGWGSVIVDPAAKGWRERIVARATELGRRGFRGVFLDTLDSYAAALPDPRDRRAAAAALASLIREIHAARPDLHLFFNRGFEILEEVGPLAAGLAAESLFRGWDAARKRYVEVPAADREWLSGRLGEVREKLRIPVVVIDYLPPGERGAAREVAKRIEALGFVPWVSSPALDALGVGSLEVLPRRVLLLHDGRESPSLAESPVHRLAALPLEHLGLVPEYLDVRGGLPRGSLAGRFAGIVTWFTGDGLPAELGYPEWLEAQIDAGLRVAVLGRLGFAASPTFLSRLGLAAVAGETAGAARITRRDSLVGLESEPAPRIRGLSRLRAASREIEVHLSVQDAAGAALDAVVTGPWGGLALDPHVLEVGYQGRVRWILDPFRFLERALGLAPGPALDLTTENGARLLLVTADAQSLAAAVRGSGELAAQVMLREILAPLPVATSVEIPAEELLPPVAEATLRDARELARAIAALPQVEVASRSARHPGPAVNGAEACREEESALAGIAGVPYGVGLDLSRAGDQPAVVPAGLGLDLSRAGDQPAVVPYGLGLDLSRTGDQPAVVPAGLGLDLSRAGDQPATDGEVECARRRGLAAFAGAGQEGPPALASLVPSGRPEGDLFQTYLPGLNDASAARLSAAGVLDREHVAALASLAGAPRRLKPIGIHYSFQIAARPSAVRALREVLEWATARRALPLWASEYADRVAEFRAATVARRLDGTFTFRGLRALRTIRLPRALGWPDLSRSRGVAAVAEEGDDLYVSFGPIERPVLALSPEPPRGPFIAWSNAALEAWEASDHAVSLRLRGHGPVLLEVGGVDGTCTLAARGETLRPAPLEGRQAFSVPDPDTGDATLQCRDE